MTFMTIITWYLVQQLHKIMYAEIFENCKRMGNSMFSDEKLCVWYGIIKLKYILLGRVNSRKVVSNLNRFSHCYSYNVLEKFETVATTLSWQQ